ncbi:hypothetical protein B296_00010528 [Ensete ventricosum]|uniref:Protein DETOXIFICATION n=1 Tax=Ensete ventricosum TaxID=4639 RepID=A0A427A446_ENSVE|nr:hypothetical protein B296_00010528 [Ensete ventricosum]
MRPRKSETAVFIAYDSQTVHTKSGGQSRTNARTRREMEEETLLTRESGEGETGEASRLVWGYAGSELLEEAQRLGCVAAPMVAVTLSQFLVQVISSMMVGHLGEVDLAGAAIATSLASVTGFSLLVSPLPPLLPTSSFPFCLNSPRKSSNLVFQAIIARERIFHERLPLQNGLK